MYIWRKKKEKKNGNKKREKRKENLKEYYDILIEIDKYYFEYHITLIKYLVLSCLTLEEITIIIQLH